jgi:murein DD-endopeptidase MepM/ murein hydrolase activator NlpD
MTRVARLLSLVLLIALAVAVAPASARDLDDDLDDVSRRIGELEADLRAAGNDRSELAVRLRTIQEDIEAAREEIAAIQSDLAAIQAELAEQQGHVDALRLRLDNRYRSLAEIRSALDAAKGEAKQWAVATYINAGAGAPTAAFSASAIEEVTVVVEYLGRVTLDSEQAIARYVALVEDQEGVLTEIEESKGELEAGVEALAAAAGDLEVLRELQHQREEELVGEYEAQEALLAAIEADIAEFETELAGLEREEASIRSLIGERARSAAKKTSAGSGILAKPASGPIVSRFGPRVHPIHGTTKMHNGIDIDGPYGATIIAAEAGTVILSGDKGGYGRTVMIDHGGGMVTLYAHMQSFSVSQGDRVSRGQKIGEIGSTGLSTGPHVHFEVRISGDPVDPMSYL